MYLEKIGYFQIYLGEFEKPKSKIWYFQNAKTVFVFFSA